MGKRIKGFKKLIAIASIALLGYAFFPYEGTKAVVSAGQDCDSNAVITCGFASKTDLVNKIDTNADVRTKFNSIGIFKQDIDSSRVVDGVVKKDGTVWVNGVKVASNVYSAGRSNMSGSTAWLGLYWRHPSVSFASDSISALVNMYGGTFRYAVLYSCGNPVLASLQPLRPGLHITKDVKNLTTDPVWKDGNTGKPGDTLRYSIEIVNNSPVTAQGVAVRDVLPNHATLVPGTGEVHVGTKVYKVTDAGLTGGIGLGNFVPTQNAFLYFNMIIKNDFTPGVCTNVTNTAFAESTFTSPTSDKAYTQVCIPGQTTTTTTTTKPTTTTTTTTKPTTTTTTTKPTTTTTTTTTTTKPTTTTTTTKPSYDLVIVKYEDKNKNGSRDRNEPYLPNWMFDVRGPNTSRIVFTDQDGDVSLTGLSAGTYTITEHQKDGWGPTESALLTKTVHLGPSSIVKFGNYKLPVVNINYSISVNKFEDMNGDRIRQDNEGLLSGWKFTLAGMGRTISQTTGANGTVTFAGLPAGEYTLVEEMQNGWRSTTGLSQKVTVGPDSVVWFGNQKVTTTTTLPPVTPVTPLELPKSGPLQAGAGVLGTMGLGYVGMLYQKSRKRFTNALKKF